MNLKINPRSLLGPYGHLIAWSLYQFTIKMFSNISIIYLAFLEMFFCQG